MPQKMSYFSVMMYTLTGGRAYRSTADSPMGFLKLTTTGRNLANNAQSSSCWRSRWPEGESQQHWCCRASGLGTSHETTPPGSAHQWHRREMSCHGPPPARARLARWPLAQPAHRPKETFLALRWFLGCHTLPGARRRERTSRANVCAAF